MPSYDSLDARDHRDFVAVFFEHLIDHVSRRALATRSRHAYDRQLSGRKSVVRLRPKRNTQMVQILHPLPHSCIIDL